MRGTRERKRGKVERRKVAEDAVGVTSREGERSRWWVQPAAKKFSSPPPPLGNERATPAAATAAAADTTAVLWPKTPPPPPRRRNFGFVNLADVERRKERKLLLQGPFFGSWGGGRQVRGDSPNILWGHCQLCKQSRHKLR